MIRRRQSQTYIGLCSFEATTSVSCFDRKNKNFSICLKISTYVTCTFRDKRIDPHQKKFLDFDQQNKLNTMWNIFEMFQRNKISFQLIFQFEFFQRFKRNKISHVLSRYLLFWKKKYLVVWRCEVTDRVRLQNIKWNLKPFNNQCFVDLNLILALNHSVTSFLFASNSSPNSEFSNWSSPNSQEFFKISFEIFQIFLMISLNQMTRAYTARLQI